MGDFIAHIKKKWVVYIMAIWMIGVTGLLYYQNRQLQALNKTNVKLSSDVDSVESILIGTDGNVAQMKQQVEDMSSRVAVIHKRVMRR